MNADFLKILLFGCFLGFISFEASAQTFSKVLDVDVTENDAAMLMPWVGGLNNPQFSDIDLNNDGIKDLVIFDRKDDKLLTFLNGGSAGQIDYSYAPEFQDAFPKMYNWALMEDYNCDGLEDLFFGFDESISVYTSSYDGGGVSFTYLYDTLVFNDPSDASVNNKLLSVARYDIPAIVDVNNDGDTDILTFNLSGGYVEYFENQSQELGYGCDSLIFDLVDYCWGKFYESGIQQAVTLNDSCTSGFTSGGGDAQRSVHPGSTLLATDLDGDGDKEMMLGDITFDNINMLTNEGDLDNAYMALQDSFFPSYDVPAYFSFFPGTFEFDTNNDELLDLVFAPNGTNQAVNLNCSWRYENVGSNSDKVYEYRQQNFLVNQMVDAGEASKPVWFDYDGDGLLDIIIGNNGYHVPGQIDLQSSMTLYRNIGTADAPAFEQVTRDYLNFTSTYPFEEMYPAFGDLDGDGDMDMLLGEQDGDLHYFTNQAGAGQEADFVLTAPEFQGIDMGQFAVPVLFDVTGNGLLDLIYGERNGNINFFENTGSASVPEFTLISENWGGVNVQQEDLPTGYASPAIGYFDNSNELYLMVGSENGQVYVYTDIEDHIYNGNFSLVTEDILPDFEGYRTTVSIADIDNDGQLEWISGNLRGGLILHEKDADFPPVGIESYSIEADVQLFPNPATDILQIANSSGLIFDTFEIVDVSGRIVLQANLLAASLNSVDVSFLDTGIYFVRIIGEDGFVVRKLMVE